MANHKNNFKNREEQIDFNNNSDFLKIAKEISKQSNKKTGNLKGIPSELYSKLIGFFMSNVKKTVFTSLYLVLSGVSLNIYFIYRLIKFLF